MESYRDCGRGSGQTAAGNAQNDGRSGGHRVAHGGPGGGEPVCSPGGTMDQSHRGEEPALAARDGRGSLGGPLRAGPELGQTLAVAGPPGHGLAPGHAQEDAVPGAPGPGVGAGGSGHEGGGGDGPERPAHVAGCGAAYQAGVVLAQQRRGDRQRVFAGD